MAKKTDFARECEGIIAEMVETKKQLAKAAATHGEIENRRKESEAEVRGLTNRHDYLKALLHETLDRHVADSE